ncbi:MAG: HEAT repeat domain-containing protein [Anaerolineales bacterium]|jgi:HEAT repeat protein
MAELQTLIDELVSGEDERAEAAVPQLAEFGQRALPVLQQLLSSEQVDRRWWAARALAAIPDPGVPTLLVDLLQDESPGIRQCAALGLRIQPDDRSVPALIPALEDQDPLTASLASDALGTIGKAAVQPLLEFLERGSPAARIEAVRALATIADERAIPALVKALDEDSAIIEYWATEGLERMGVGMVFFKP